MGLLYDLQKNYKNEITKMTSFEKYEIKINI